MEPSLHSKASQTLFMTKTFLVRYMACKAGSHNFQNSPKYTLATKRVIVITYFNCHCSNIGITDTEVFCLYAQSLLPDLSGRLSDTSSALHKFIENGNVLHCYVEDSNHYPYYFVQVYP